MKLSLLVKLLFPVTMMTLVSCTLVISSAQDPEQGTGLGSGTVTVEDAAVLGICTITDGVPQADCVMEPDPWTIWTLVPFPDASSEFLGWTGPCNSIYLDQCVITFDSLDEGVIQVTAHFARLSCQGLDACTGVGEGVGQGSCNDNNACNGADGPVGNNSCNEYYACYSASSIGNNSCNGFGACTLVDVAIGNNSCNTEGSACKDATEDIGDCMNNDVTPEACLP